MVGGVGMLCEIVGAGDVLGEIVGTA